MRSLRIAIVYDPLYPYVRGGAERRYHEIGRRLAADHEVTFLSWQWWDGPARIERDGMTFHGVGRPPSLYGTDGKRTVREALSFASRVGWALARGEWDVVECSATPYLPLYAAWAATRVTRTPLVATWHEFWGDHWLEYLPDRPVVARVARVVEAAARPLGDALVAVSDFTLRRLGRVPSARDRVVPNGVAGAPEPRVERLVDVAYVGRLIDEKRLDLLVDAVAALRDAGRHVRCVIAGDGPAREDLARHATTRGVADLVELPGRLDDAMRDALLAGTRVFAMPSLREGFGMSVLEAQAAGAVPVVVRGPHTAAADLVTDGVDGRICEATAASLAAAIGALLDDDIERGRMSAAARRAAQRYDWDAIAASMAEVYGFVARSGPAMTEVKAA